MATHEANAEPGPLAPLLTTHEVIDLLACFDLSGTIDERQRFAAALVQRITRAHLERAKVPQQPGSREEVSAAMMLELARAVSKLTTAIERHAARL